MLSEEDINSFLIKKPLLQWDADLPETKDYKERTEICPAPQDLKPGLYILFASHDPAFNKEDNQVSITFVWISDLALTIRKNYQKQRLEGFVVQAETGEPIAGASVNTWIWDRKTEKYHSGDKTQTNQNGMFSFQSNTKDRRSMLGLVSTINPSLQSSP